MPRKAVTEEDLKRAGERARAGPAIQRDEHGCVVGKEIWDEEKGECVPLPPEPAEWL